MDLSLNCQAIQSKINQLYRLTPQDSDEKIKNSLREILQLWPDILSAGDQANDDELFTLNVSRAAVTQVFAIVSSKDFFIEDHVLVREIFFSCFNILANHTDIFQYENSRPTIIFIDSNIRLLIKMLTSIASSVRFSAADFCTTNDHRVFTAMREHIDQDATHDNLTDVIISLVWNLSDTTLLVPLLLQTGYAKSVVQWIDVRQMKFREDKLDAPIHILHNLARHDAGIKELNCYDALGVIDRLEINSQSPDDANEMVLHIAMIRALLTDVHKIKCETDKYPHQIVDNLVQLSIDAAKNTRHRSNGSHVSEPLTVLVKLFYNDRILHSTLLCANETELKETTRMLLELLSALFVTLYPKIARDNDVLEHYTCVVILNFLWLISNHQRYRQIIRDQEEFNHRLKSATNDKQTFIETFLPRTMKSIQQTANDILLNLNSIES